MPDHEGTELTEQKPKPTPLTSSAAKANHVYTLTPTKWNLFKEETRDGQEYAFAPQLNFKFRKLNLLNTPFKSDISDIEENPLVPPQPMEPEKPGRVDTTEPQEEKLPVAIINIAVKPPVEIKTEPMPEPQPSKVLEPPPTDIPSTLMELLKYLFNDVYYRRHELLALNPSRRIRLFRELEQITSYFDRDLSRDIAKMDFSAVILSEDPRIQRSITIFCHRVAHYTLLHFLIIKYWAEIGLLKSEDLRYSDLNFTIRKVLSQWTQNLVEEKYSWLFIKQNTYSWYRHPKDLEDVIVNRMGKHTLREHSGEILNILYENYLLSIGKQQSSLFTPTPIVKFTWDKILTNGQQTTSLFRKIGGSKKPKAVLDPTMGSGNFLLEAARRMESELQKENSNGGYLKDLLNGITEGLYGCDIDSFAHIFCETKLLWQFSPAIMNKKTYMLPQNFALSAIHQNSLKLHNDDQLQLSPSDHFPVLPSDTRFGVLPLEGHLKRVHCNIKTSTRFDFVVSCPPESNNEELIHEVLTYYPYWQQFYQRGMNYSSWFFILGISKLREGGRLGIVTDTYWPTSEGGNKLRKFILEHARVLEIIDLSEYNAGENKISIPKYVTIIERCSEKEKRDSSKIKITKIMNPANNLSVSDILQLAFSNGQEVKTPGQVINDDYHQIFFSAIPQGSLDEHPWTIIQESGFSSVLQHIAKIKQTLGTTCFLDRGESISNDAKAGEALVTAEFSKSNAFRLVKDFSPVAPREIVIHKKPNSRESIKYIQALLNSNLSTFWYRHNGDQRSGRLVYTIQTLKMLPIRTINFDTQNSEIPAERLHAIKQAIRRKDNSFIEATLKLELEHGHEEVVHDAIVELMDEIEQIKKQQNKYRPFISQSKDGEETISNIAVYPIFPRNRLCPLRDHPAVQFDVCGDTNMQTFCLVNTVREPGIKYEREHLMLISNDGGSFKIYAPGDLLDLLQSLLAKRVNDFWEEFSAGIFLPTDLHLWEAQKLEILNTYLALKDQEVAFRNLIDTIINRLYGFSPSSTDEVFQQFSKDAISLIASSAPQNQNQ